MHQAVSADLVRYLAGALLPAYARFDPAHNADHIRTVIENSMELAQGYDVHPDMVYTIAAYHYIGLSQGRKTHHLTSGRMLAEDTRLLQWFTPQQIAVMREAIRITGPPQPRRPGPSMAASSPKRIAICARKP